MSFVFDICFDELNLDFNHECGMAFAKLNNKTQHDALWRTFYDCGTLVPCYERPRERELPALTDDASWLAMLNVMVADGTAPSREDVGAITEQQFRLRTAMAEEATGLMRKVLGELGTRISSRQSQLAKNWPLAA